MYKVLLADDEKLACRNMEKVLEELGEFEVDVAVDGAEAILLIRSRPYDVVILDIQMPRYNGIEVLKLIDDVKPVPIKLIISGYDYFEYAQAALKYGVGEFLVKPISPEQIKELMKRTVVLLEQRNLLLNHEKKAEEELKKSQLIVRERFVERLVCSKGSKASLQEQLQYYEMNFQWPFFSVALLTLEMKNCQYEEAQQIAHELALFSRLQECSNDELGIYAFHTMGDRIGVLFNYKTEQKKESVENVLGELSQLFKTYYGVQLIGGVGRTKRTIETVHKSFQEALMAFRWCAVSKNDVVTFYSDFYDDAIEVPDEMDVNTLVAELINGEADSIVDFVNKQFSTGSECTAGVFSVIHQVVSACRFACENSGINCDKEIFAQAMAVMCMDYTQLQLSAPEVLEKLIRSSCAQIANKNEEKGGLYVRKAKRIIEDAVNSGTVEISVGLLANELGLSKNYFGKVFKAGVGMSFSNYVNDLRIKRAANLLRTTNMKVYEVAQRVGYENQHYFSVAFKEKIGVPPSEFRDLI